MGARRIAVAFAIVADFFEQARNHGAALGVVGEPHQGSGIHRHHHFELEAEHQLRQSLQIVGEIGRLFEIRDAVTRLVLGTFADAAPGREKAVKEGRG